MWHRAAVVISLPYSLAKLFYQVFLINHVSPDPPSLPDPPFHSHPPHPLPQPTFLYVQSVILHRFVKLKLPKLVLTISNHLFDVLICLTFVARCSKKLNLANFSAIWYVQILKNGRISTNKVSYQLYLYVVECNDGVSLVKRSGNSPQVVKNYCSR